METPEDSLDIPGELGGHSVQGRLSWGTRETFLVRVDTAREKRAIPLHSRNTTIIKKTSQVSLTHLRNSGDIPGQGRQTWGISKTS